MQVKICGLSSKEAADAAIDSGADDIGFVHFQKSPRHLEFDAIQHLIRHVDGRADCWIVTASADLELIRTLCCLPTPPFGIQIHGALPEGAEEFLCDQLEPVFMQAFSVATREDVRNINISGAADLLLFDAKPRPDDKLPGGNGVSFDWAIMDALRDVPRLAGRPWYLAGGLTPENIAEAIQQSGAHRVDVSSGVESAPGIKDVTRIAQFIRAAKSV